MRRRACRLLGGEYAGEFAATSQHPSVHLLTPVQVPLLPCKYRARRRPMWGSTVCFTAERAARREGDRGGGSGAARAREAGTLSGVSAQAEPAPQPRRRRRLQPEGGRSGHYRAFQLRRCPRLSSGGGGGSPREGGRGIDGRFGPGDGARASAPAAAAAARGREVGTSLGVSALTVPSPQPEEGGSGAAAAGIKKPKGHGDGPAEGLAAEAGRRSGCKSARRPAVYCDEMDQ